MFKAQEFDSNSIRSLQEAELDSVTGGIMGGCIPNQPFPMGPAPSGDWTFNSVFTRYVIGRNLPVPA